MVFHEDTPKNLFFMRLVELTVRVLRGIRRAVGYVDNDITRQLRLESIIRRKTIQLKVVQVEQCFHIFFARNRVRKDVQTIYFFSRTFPFNFFRTTVSPDGYLDRKSVV